MRATAEDDLKLLSKKVLRSEFDRLSKVSALSWIELLRG